MKRIIKYLRFFIFVSISLWSEISFCQHDSYVNYFEAGQGESNFVTDVLNLNEDSSLVIGVGDILGLPICQSKIKYITSLTGEIQDEFYFNINLNTSAYLYKSRICDNYLYSVGFSDPQGQFNLINSLVSKVNLNGSIEWIQESGVANVWDRAEDFIFGPLGNIYLTGFVEDSIGIKKQMLIAKHTIDGELIWQQKVEAQSGSLYGRSIVVGVDGYLYIIGQSGSSNNKQACLVKMSTDGEIIWTKYEALSGYNNPSYMVEGENNNLIVSASVSYDSIEGGTVPSFMEFNLNGEVQWVRHYYNELGQNNGSSERFIKTKTGGYATALNLTIDNDYVPTLLVVDAAGEPLLVKHFEGLGIHTPVGIDQFEDGSFLIAGNLYAGIAGIDGFWILKTDAEGNITSVDIESTEIVDWQVYPNPVVDHIVLQVSDELASKNIQMNVMSVSGSILFNKQLTSSNELVDLSKYPAGNYFVNLLQDGQLIGSKQIVKVK